MSVELQRRLFTVDEYHAMVRAGVLTEDDRVELIEGEVVEMAPIGSRHAACVDRLNHLLAQRSGGQAIIRVQNPVRLSDLAEPEPDLALLRPRDDFYSGAHPRGTDVLLVVEVAETSLAYDRERKLPLYARAGIPEVWLVDLSGHAVEIHSSPSAEEYARVVRVGRDGVLEPTLLEGIEVRVGEIL